MNKSLKTSTLLKIAIVLVMVFIWGWSGWLSYQSLMKVRQPNPELINTFRVIFQPERIKQAAEILSQKKSTINNLPVSEPTPEPVES